MIAPFVTINNMMSCKRRSCALQDRLLYSDAIDLIIMSSTRLPFASATLDMLTQC